MAQLNIYVADEEAGRLRERAAKAGVSLSRYVVSLIDRDSGQSPSWPPLYFENACGFLCDDASFPDIQDAAPEPVEDLDLG